MKITEILSIYPIHQHTVHTATAEARKLSTICEKFGKKFRQIDAHIFHLIEMLDYAILNGLYL